MNEFVKKLIERLEKSKNETESEMNLLLDREYLLPCSMNQIDMEEYRVSTFEDAISIVNELAEEYKHKYVSIEVYKQVAGERDIAIEQLHELGYEFGQKIN